MRGAALFAVGLVALGGWSPAATAEERARIAIDGAGQRLADDDSPDTQRPTAETGAPAADDSLEAGADSLEVNADDSEGTAEADDAEASDDGWGGDGEAGLGPISGKTLAYARAPFDDSDFQQLSTSLWLGARPRFNQVASARFELAFDDIVASQTEAEELRVALREAYVTLRKRGWLVRAGRQIVPWGASDVVNPTDFLTARDYRFFAVDAEDTRRGGLSLLVAHATPRLAVELVVTPRFPTSSVLIPPAALPAGVSLTAPEVPPPSLDDTEVAGKLKVSGDGWDLALVGFRGRSHTPELELVSATETAAVLRHAYRRMVAAGLDGSTSVGKLILRLEGSYAVPLDNLDGADPTRLPPVGFAVLGLERPLGPRLRAQAQVLVRVYPRWTDPAAATGADPATTAALQGVAASNALLLDYQDDVRPAATARVAYASEDGGLEAEVFAAMNLIGNDFLVRPLVGWHPVETVSLQVGADMYGGPSDRPLGALEPFGGAFGQLSYLF